MSILADCHLHSHFSADSEAKMEDMVQAAIARGLTTMTFTEHNDFDMPDLPDFKAEDWVLNVDSYLYELLRLKEKYEGQIRILFGVEIGFQESCMRQDAVLAKAHEFDFIIGSTHVVRKMDPYYPEFFQGRDKEEAYHEYFLDELTNIKKHSNFDVYGHLDYVVRYGNNPTGEYDYSKHADVFDEILTALIEKGKGIELNTAGYKGGRREPNPCASILKRYRELGGEIITIGSDAHSPDRVGENIDRAREILLDCGFKYYNIFEKRNAEYHKL